MQQYTQRTNGSYIDDDKKASITWHWSSSKDRSNHEFGALQGKELHNHLQEMLAHFAVRVVIGRTYVRVRHEGVTKGCFVEYVTNHYNKRGGVDMLMVIADDVADEDIFTVAAAYHRDVLYRVVSSSTTLQEVKVFACTVGRQPSSASYCLFNAEEVFELMGGLYLLNKRINRRAGGKRALHGSGSPTCSRSRSPSSSYRSPSRGSPGRSSSQGSRGSRTSLLTSSLSPARRFPPDDGLIGSRGTSRDPSPFPRGATSRDRSLSPATPAAAVLTLRSTSGSATSPLMLPAAAWSMPPALAEGRAESAEVRHWRVLDEQAENARARLLAPDHEPLLVHVDADRDRDRDRALLTDGARGRPTVRAEASALPQSGQPGRRRQHSNEAGPFSTRAAGGSRALGVESGVGDVGDAQLREWEHRRDWSPDQTRHGWRDWSPGEGRVR